MKWFILVPLNFLVMFIAYIINPIVAIFANEYGWLPKSLYWFQTYDNTLDVAWFVKEKMPKFLQYDYDQHYIYIPENKNDILIPGHVLILNPDFSIIEKLKRYICRIGWLYRNTAYGFSYDVTGAEADYTKQKVIKCIKTDKLRIWISYIDDGSNLWNRTWCFLWSKKYYKDLALTIFLGWKIQDRVTGKDRAQIANRISPFR